MSSGIAAKILGGILCLAFLFTLKPLLRRAAGRVPAAIRGDFIFEVEALGHASSVPGSAVLALLAGIGLWVVVGIALSPVLGDDPAVLVGAAAGLFILYPHFFLVLYGRAQRAASERTK